MFKNYEFPSSDDNVIILFMEEHLIINKESMLPIGTILHGAYCINRYLSSGGFGNTYIASHVDLNDVVAIKEFFMRGVVQRDENQITVSVSNSDNRNHFIEQKEKFKKEARRIRQLKNDYIVNVYDLFEENGTAYYVMDYVDGENLAERLKRTGLPMSEKEVNKILPQILEALKSVHAAGIWHLDLKPANIMIDKAGNVKLIDFGASKQLNAQKGGATTSTAISYTNGYAPREQMEQNYDKFGPWTDFYALGATLYNLLSNKRPPLPTDIDDDRSFDKHLSLPLPSETSTRTQQLILWLTQTNRQDRPSSVGQIVDFLENNQVQYPEIGNDNADLEETISMQPIGRSDSETNPSLPPSSKSVPNKNRIIFKVITPIIILAVFVIVALMVLPVLNKETEKSNIRPVVIEESIDSLLHTVTNTRIIIPEGECTYTGEVNTDGIPNGKGQAWFKDGRYYKGGFVNGNMHGENAYFCYKQGDVFEGSFENNKFSQGTFTINSSGEYFRGTFQDGNPLHGKWFDKNGNLLEEI